MSDFLLNGVRLQGDICQKREERGLRFEEARELVHFCRDHTDMQSREGMIILKVLKDEVCETFKEVLYIHIGTDEVVFINPDSVKEMLAYIRAKGKKVVSWNPGWSF